MKDILLMYARYTQRANLAVIALLDALSPEARSENRKSWYGSLLGLVLHIVGGAQYFQGMFKAVLPAVARILATAERVTLPDDKALSPSDWTVVRNACVVADQATVDLVAGLSEAELASPIPLDWYEGHPDSVPLCFLLHQLYVHGIHHRGQASQILDEMGIEHDFSGIDVEFLPKKA